MTRKDKPSDRPRRTTCWLVIVLEEGHKEGYGLMAITPDSQENNMSTSTRNLLKVALNYKSEKNAKCIFINDLAWYLKNKNMSWEGTGIDLFSSIEEIEHSTEIPLLSLRGNGMDKMLASSISNRKITVYDEQGPFEVTNEQRRAFRNAVQQEIENNW